MYIIFLAVSFLASIVGAICGIGGGVIIKPVLDALGIMSVSSISFLSGCTVLSMSCVSVLKSMKKGSHEIDMKKGTLLAIGAAVGGILGKELFEYAYIICPDENKVGAIQAFVLLLVTVGSLLFVIFKNKIKTLKVENRAVCLIIGLLLGIMSAFLGIGGGPINLVVLTYFFTMNIKQAASNSLYIILFSQTTSLISSFVQQNIPEFSMISLALMVIGGVAGAMVGSKLNKRLESNKVNQLFICLMLVIIGINIYNMIKFIYGSI